MCVMSLLEHHTDCCGLTVSAVSLRAAEVAVLAGTLCMRGRWLTINGGHERLHS